MYKEYKDYIEKNNIEESYMQKELGLMKRSYGNSMYLSRTGKSTPMWMRALMLGIKLGEKYKK